MMPVCQILLGCSQIVEAVAQTCFVRKVFLEILQNSQENTCAKAAGLRPEACNFIKKETLAQVFPCPVNFAKISKSTFSYRAPPVAAFEIATNANLVWQMFFKIDILKYFTIFTGKYLFWSLFSIKLQT